MPSQKKEPARSFAVVVSPAVHDILEAEIVMLANKGLNASYRELADKAIIASYGNQQQASGGSSEGV